MGSCGLPVPGSAVRIVDPESGADVDPGDDGELLVRGPHVMLGYHGKPDATEEALRHGWYHTGDLGHQDENGYLTITGRSKELIIRGGENIYPAEVEEVVSQCEAVADVAVAPKQDDALGEVPVAFVVPADPDSFDEDEVLEFCAGRMARFKVPAEVQLVQEIPRTGSGKVKRFQLQELL
jgi:long-chain acyl-CoA synthetase